jgi:hypothetical protein
LAVQRDSVRNLGVDVIAPQELTTPSDDLDQPAELFAGSPAG